MSEEQEAPAGVSSLKSRFEAIANANQQATSTPLPKREFNKSTKTATTAATATSPNPTSSVSPSQFTNNNNGGQTTPPITIPTPPIISPFDDNENDHIQDQHSNTPASQDYFSQTRLNASSAPAATNVHEQEQQQQQQRGRRPAPPPPSVPSKTKLTRQASTSPQPGAISSSSSVPSHPPPPPPPPRIAVEEHNSNTINSTNFGKSASEPVFMESPESSSSSGQSITASQNNPSISSLSLNTNTNTNSNSNTNSDPTKPRRSPPPPPLLPQQSNTNNIAAATSNPSSNSSSSSSPQLPPRVPPRPPLQQPQPQSPSILSTQQGQLPLAEQQRRPPPPPVPNRPHGSASSVPSPSLRPPPAPPRGRSPSTPSPAVPLLDQQYNVSPSEDAPRGIPSQTQAQVPPPPPPVRSLQPKSGNSSSATPASAPASNNTSQIDSDESSEEEDLSTSSVKKMDDLPDSTFASRRPPVVEGKWNAHARSHLTCSAVRRNYIVIGGHHHPAIKVFAADTGSLIGTASLPSETRITSLSFKPANNQYPDYLHFWAGTKDGGIYEIEATTCTVVTSRQATHTGNVMGIWPVLKPSNPRKMVSLDDSGKLLIWPDADLSGQPRVQRLSSPTAPTETSSASTSFNGVFVSLVGHQLWVASRAAPGKGPYIRVFDVSGDPNVAFNVNTRSACLPGSAGAGTTSASGPNSNASSATSLSNISIGSVGSVSAACFLPSDPNRVYLAHETGHISIWLKSEVVCIKVVRISTYHITALCGVYDTLWAGYRTGFIYVYKPHRYPGKPEHATLIDKEPWKVLKSWKAHPDAAVTYIGHDLTALQDYGKSHVYSSGVDGLVNIWDGFLRGDWIDEEMTRLEASYCTHRPIRVLICTWNIDARKPQHLTTNIQNNDFLQNLLMSVDSPDIIVFGFQELIDLENKKLTAKSMLLGKKRADSKFNEQVSHQYRIWHDRLVQAVRVAMPPNSPFSVVHTDNMVGLFTCIFVKNSEVKGLGDINMTKVKTGMGGLHGNKGAILARFVIDDSSLCFINCHLAAGQSHKRQRNQDLVDVLEKSVLSDTPSVLPYAYTSGSGGIQVFDHELVFLNGDLNYRIDSPREMVVHAIKNNDLQILLERDQLLKELGTNHSFRLRSFKEPTITFAPTYKYDRNSDTYDSSEKKRIPAWCDRVLWRTPPSDIDRVKPLHYGRHEVNISDHRPVSAGFEVLVRKVIPEQRLQVLESVEKDWYKIEKKKLDECLEFWKPYM